MLKNLTEDHTCESLLDHTTDLIEAYVKSNVLPPKELPDLIRSVHAALASLSGATNSAVVEDDVEKPTTVQIRRSIARDALISFIDGKPYKTLKRHLQKHGLDPDSYRERYDLPSDYPMTARSYSEQRSALARMSGLGQHGTRAGAAE